MYKFNINLSIYIIRDDEMHSVNNSIHTKYIFKILVSLSIIRSFAKKIEAILLLSFQVKSEQYFHLGKKSVSLHSQVDACVESTERVYILVLHADYTVLRDSTRCLPEGRVIPVEPSQPSV